VRQALTLCGGAGSDQYVLTRTSVQRYCKRVPREWNTAARKSPDQGVLGRQKASVPSMIKSPNHS